MRVGWKCWKCPWLKKTKRNVMHYHFRLPHVIEVVLGRFANILHIQKLVEYIGNLLKGLFDKLWNLGFEIRADKQALLFHNNFFLSKLRFQLNQTNTINFFRVTFLTENLGLGRKPRFCKQLFFFIFFGSYSPEFSVFSQNYSAEVISK